MTNELLLVLLLFADSKPPATQTIHKCRATDGSVSFQSTPCRGTETVSTQSVERAADAPVPVPEPSAAPGPPQTIVVIDRDPPPGRASNEELSRLLNRQCERAKANAAAKRDQYWNSYTSDTLRELDAWVERNCRTLILDTCAPAYEAGISNIQKGQMGYAPHLDADYDGFACE